MSISSNFDGIVTLQSRPDDLQVPPEPEPHPLELHPIETAKPEVVAPAVETYVSHDVPARARPRPRWILSVAIAAAGLIASGALGYLFWSTSNHLDAARHQLAVTQAGLASTKQALSTAQSDAAAKKAVDGYVSMVVVDGGRIQTDYQNTVLCNNYGECRTAAQQLLTDLHAFQSARTSASTPAALGNSDGMLGDALSAAIAGTQEFISGMDNNNLAKIKDGGSKVDAAMLSVAKAESALGAEIQ